MKKMVTPKASLWYTPILEVFCIISVNTGKLRISGQGQKRTEAYQ